MFVPIYSYTVTEHDPSRPWIVLEASRGLTVELEDAQSFYEWAAKSWPCPRYSVDLDPWQLTPES
jgi:hypothetical protein